MSIGFILVLDTLCWSPPAAFGDSFWYYWHQYLKSLNFFLTPPSAIITPRCLIIYTPDSMPWIKGFSERLPISVPVAVETRWGCSSPLCEILHFRGEPLVHILVTHCTWVPSPPSKTITVPMEGFLCIYFFVTTTTCGIFPDPFICVSHIPPNLPATGAIHIFLLLLYCRAQRRVYTWIPGPPPIT